MTTPTHDSPARDTVDACRYREMLAAAKARGYAFVTDLIEAHDRMRDAAPRPDGKAVAYRPDSHGRSEPLDHAAPPPGVRADSFGRATTPERSPPINPFDTFSKSIGDDSGRTADAEPHSCRCGRSFVESFGTAGCWYVGCKPCDRHVHARTRSGAIAKWNRATAQGEGKVGE